MMKFFDWIADREHVFVGTERIIAAIVLAAMLVGALVALAR
jgi:hypothetical protein